MNYSNCFPADWIGKKLVRVNDSCYFVNGDSTKQVAVPFGHKGVSARWLPNGVLRIDTDSNVNYFFVGSQRFFEAYGDETEPHDIRAYKKAVEECQRYRAEEGGKNVSNKDRHSNNNNELDDISGNKNRGRTGLGAIVAGAGAAIGSAKKAIQEYRSIDDTSFLEEASEKIFDDMQNSWEKYNKPVDYGNWLEETPFDKEMREYDESLKKAKIEISKVLREYQHQCDFLLIGLSMMLGVNKKDIKYACEMFWNPMGQYSDREIEKWTELFYEILQGERFTDQEIDRFKQMVNQQSEQDRPEVKQIKRSTKITNSQKENVGEDMLERRNAFELLNTSKKEQTNCNDKKDEKDNERKQITVEQPSKKKKTTKSNVPAKDTEDGDKYTDLINSGFKKENCDEELLKPKNAFDLITKGKNKQISYYKNKWNDSMWKRDHELKKKIKHEIVRIEEKAIELLSYDEKLNKLIQSGKSTGFWGFGGSKEVNDVKSRMKTIKERISEYKDKLMEALDDLDSCEEKIQEYSDELYELTNLKKYTEFKRLEGKGMSVARQLAKCKIDPSNLKTIFEL